MIHRFLRTVSKEEAALAKTHWYKGVEDHERRAASWIIFTVLLRCAGPVIFMGLQLSSVATAREVVRNKSVGALSPVPNIALFSNCVVWTLYGALIKDLTVFVPNGIGIVTAIYCMVEFHRFSAIKPYKMYVAAAAVCGACAYLASIGNASTVGLVGCAMAVLFMASPLSVVRTVIRDKSTAALPFATSLVIFFNALSWLLYGSIVAHDVLVWGPNALGFLLACVQLGLFLAYGFPETSDDELNKAVKDRL